MCSLYLSEVDLTKLFRDNPLLLASRNAEGKTARDVAAEAGIQENVDQLGSFQFTLEEESFVKLSLIR